MPVLVPERVEKIDISVLEDLDLDTEPNCDNDMPGLDEHKATHSVRCACRTGVEFTCLPCMLMFKALPKDLAYISFNPNKSCGHTCHIDDCEIAPLK